MFRSLLALLVLPVCSIAIASPAQADGFRWPWERSRCCPPAPCAPVCAPVVCAPVCAPVVQVPNCEARLIPAAYETRTRAVECPAVTCEVQVPNYETVEHPVYATTCTPQYRDVEIPCYAVRQIPITRSICDPCTGVTHEEICGYRSETYQNGSRTERQFAGNLSQTVQTGVRTEQRFTGYRTEARVVTPARTDLVSERVLVSPSRRVTVATTAPVSEVRLLSGTTEVLSREQYEREVAATSSR